MKQPGAKIEEHQVGHDMHGIRFSDAAGTAYCVIRIDSTGGKFTLEKYRTNPTLVSCSGKTITWTQIGGKNYGWLD